MQFTYRTGALTDVGLRRDVNEDSLVSLETSGLWVVADGMGGHAAGDFASQTIVREMVSVGRPSSILDLEGRVVERLHRANEAIVDHALELDVGTIGSTVAALLIYECEYRCIWSGDSRVYLYRNDALSQCTQDHTEVAALLMAGSITPEEARSWPRRNVITHAIGVSDDVHCDIVAGVARAGDVFLLCSDGLTEHVEDDEIGAALAQHAPEDACEALVATTLKRGARDNVTVVAVELLPEAATEDEILFGDEYP